MRQRKRILAELLANPFDLKRFIEFVKAFFDGADIFPDSYSFIQRTILKALTVEYSEHIADCMPVSRYICNYDSLSRKIAILAVHVNRKASSRSDRNYTCGLERSYLSKVLDALKADAAIAAFYAEGESLWRLSFVRPIRITEDKAHNKGASSVKRTSWISCAGAVAVMQLVKYLRKNRYRPSYKDIARAFSFSVFLKDFNKSWQNDPGLLRSYYFTAAENEPLEQELSVSPEMLGSILEIQMPDMDRKRRGTFYTPSEIVHYMCRESLLRYTANNTQVPYEELETLFQYSDFLEPEDYCLPGSIRQNLRIIDHLLENVKVFDPAVGSGVFLLGMLNEIVKIRNTITRFLFAEKCILPKNRHPYRLKETAIKNCLFAKDIDRRAVEITKLRLWCSLVLEYEPSAGLPEPPCRIDDLLSDIFSNMRDRISIPDIEALGEHILWGDSLLNGTEPASEIWPAVAAELEMMTGWDFDIVVGNPPYVSAVEGSKTGADIRRALRIRFPMLRGAFDIYTAFLLQGIRWTAQNGVYCWIVPNKLLVSKYAEPVLEHLKQNGLVKSISISEIDTFSNVGVYPIIIEGSRKIAKPEHFEEYAAYSMDELLLRNLHKKSVSRISSLHSFCPSSFQTFADCNIKFASGAAGFQAQILAGSISENRLEDSIPFVVSGCIDKYSLRYDKVRFMGVTYEKAFIRKTKKIADRKWALWCNEKIIIAGLTKKIEAAWCPEPLAIGVGTYAIYDFAGFDPLYLLALINSLFMDWYMWEAHRERHLAGGYITINKSILEQMPLAAADESTRVWIAKKAKDILQLYEQNGACEKAEQLRREIDKVVCGLYKVDYNHLRYLL